MRYPLTTDCLILITTAARPWWAPFQIFWSLTVSGAKFYGQELNLTGLGLYNYEIVKRSTIQLTHVQLDQPL